MVLKLYKILSSPKYPLAPEGLPLLFRLVIEQPLIKRSGNACCTTDEALMKFPQGFHIHAGFIIKAFQVGTGHQLNQILPPGFIFRQQKEMCVFAAAGKLFFTLMGVGER